MQTRLLPLLYDLEKSATSCLGLWLVHTDESLVVDWLIDGCRPIWSNNNQIINRMELSSPKSWYDVANELSSLNLFGEHTALIVTGKHKPDIKDKTLMTSLNQFAKDVANGHSQNHLIWCLPRQDKKSLATKAIQFFNQEGLLIDGNIYDEKQRGEFLKFKAQQLGLRLAPNAWQMLLHATEQHLLSAYQTLWRLSFLPHGDTITTDELEQALVAGADFNVFDLSDALISSNAPKALNILHHLKHTDTAPSIVLWAVAKDARLITQIQAGKDPATLGIWSNKIHLYTQSAHRTNAISGTWLTEIYTLDKMIKGVSADNVWLGLERLCLKICGITAV